MRHMDTERLIREESSPGDLKSDAFLEWLLCLASALQASRRLTLTMAVEGLEVATDRPRASAVLTSQEWQQ